MKQTSDCRLCADHNLYDLKSKRAFQTFSAGASISEEPDAAKT